PEPVAQDVLDAIRSLLRGTRTPAPSGRDRRAVEGQTARLHFRDGRQYAAHGRDQVGWSRLRRRRLRQIAQLRRGPGGVLQTEQGLLVRLPELAHRPRRG